jgi:hypothetical protein
MTWLELLVDGIPPELRVQPFVLWRAVPNPDGGKPTKRPYQISDPDRPASTTSPSTWGTFADAVDGFAALARLDDATRGPVVGIAVILTAAAQLFCIDLDSVLDGETLDPRAASIVGLCDSFTERSPSGTGLHIFGRGHVRQAIRKPHIEVYGAARMICLSGWRWPGTPFALNHCQPYLNYLHDLAQPPGPARPARAPEARDSAPDDLGGTLLARVHAWRLDVTGPLTRWRDGYRLELRACPWASSHTTGPGGAAIFIRASGAFDFVCLHTHCASRTWKDFRTRMEMA